MSSDLDTVDATKPDGATEAVNVLDNYERETRLALKDWAAIEHGATGRHKFGVGNTASRPATVLQTGTLYINNQTRMLEYYDGANFIPVNSMNAMSFYRYGFNMSFEKWGSGLLSAPTWWTLTGAGATIAQTLVAADVKHGLSAVALTRVGTNCYISQDLSLIHKPLAWWKGRALAVFFGMWVRQSAATASRSRIGI